MKKLLIAAVVCSMAAFAEAASVVWGGAISNPDASGPLEAGQTAMLIWSASEFSGAATQIAGTTIGATANNGGSVVASHTLSASEVDFNVAEFSDVWNNEGKDVNGFYAILITDATGSSASYMDMGQIEGTTPASAAQSIQFNAGWADESATLTQGGYTVTVDIPEPTSGLLLILGMAGLALRRRRA